MNRFTSRLYENYARIGKVLSSARRIELLELLAQAPHSVEELVQLSGMSVANTSQHLQLLRQHGLVEAQKQGLYVIYRLASPEVHTFLQQLGRLAQSQLAEVKQIEAEFLAQAEAWQSVDVAQLQAQLAAGALLLDVRPAEEYAAGHIPGAVSAPLPELAERMAQMPKQQTVIAYCRGPYCLYALEAVHRLSEQGFQSLHFREGMAGWRDQAQALEAT
ncbi:MAG: ArsR/SmtB family transcription factor [Candidatus Sericytochromatia bacterium]